MFTRKNISPAILAALTYLEVDGPSAFLQEHRKHLDSWLHRFYPGMNFESTNYIFADNARLTKLVSSIRAEARVVWDIAAEHKLLTRVKEIQQMIENLEELWELLDDQYGLTLPEPTAT